MNVFEDLIVELKEENLLENTVIDAKRQNKKPTDIPEASAAHNDHDGQPEFAASDGEMTEFDSRSSQVEADTEVVVVETAGEFQAAAAETKHANLKEHGTVRNFLRNAPLTKFRAIRWSNIF